MHNIKEDILNKSTQLYGELTISQHLYNDTIDNKSSLQRVKEKLLKELIKDNTDLVKTTKQYPNNDIQDILLEVDLLLISRKQLEKIFKDE